MRHLASLLREQCLGLYYSLCEGVVVRVASWCSRREKLGSRLQTGGVWRWLRLALSKFEGPLLGHLLGLRGGRLRGECVPPVTKQTMWTLEIQSETRTQAGRITAHSQLRWSFYTKITWLKKLKFPDNDNVIEYTAFSFKFLTVFLTWYMRSSPASSIALSISSSFCRSPEIALCISGATSSSMFLRPA